MQLKYFKIFVSSEEEKQCLIEQSKYIHDFAIKIRGRKSQKINWKCLDADKAGILMHIYTCPDDIEVLNIRELPEDIIKHGIEVFGNKEQFEKWLLSSPPITRGKKVIDLSDEEINDELGRIEHGLFS